MLALNLRPRYAPIIIDGPFRVATIIDGSREVEHVDVMIEQLEAENSPPPVRKKRS